MTKPCKHDSKRGKMLLVAGYRYDILFCEDCYTAYMRVEYGYKRKEVVIPLKVFFQHLHTYLNARDIPPVDFIASQIHEAIRE